MPPKRPAGKAPDVGVNFALKKLRDGRDGRPGSIDEVLRKVHALEAAVKRQPEVRKTLADLNLTEAYREVVDLPGREVAAAIEQVMVAVAKNVLDGEGFTYALPSRGANDQVYLEQLDRIAWLEAVDYVVDAFFWVDILISFRTAYFEDSGEMVVDARAIARCESAPVCRMEWNERRRAEMSHSHTRTMSHPQYIRLSGANVIILDRAFRVAFSVPRTDASRA